MDGGTLLERVVHARGLADSPRAEQLLRHPRFALLHPPATLPGADAVAERIAVALRERRRIALYGDYDADGVTAIAVLWHVLRALAPEAEVEWFVPSRFEHGYGVHSEVLRAMHARGVRTVVTVDCGIGSLEPARTAREIGLELLVTDHHALWRDAEGRVELPCADAIAHPELPGAEAPFTGLCAAAVAFKVGKRLATHWFGGERVPAAMQQTLAYLSPLVALGTVADVVPLVDENRVFVAEGLRILRTVQGQGAPGVRARPSTALDVELPMIPGLRALMDTAELHDGSAVDAEHIAFRLAPRLNAIGRLGHAADAVELLTTANSKRAQEIARALVRHNDERRRIEQEIHAQACAMADAALAARPADAIVLAHPEWHEGVVGIVCSRLVERYGRPCLLLRERPDGTAKGSGRGVEGFDLAAALRGCDEHLASHGGHAAAVGLTTRAGKREAFARVFQERWLEAARGENLASSARYDAVVTLDELSLPALRTLDVLRPCGRGHREPAFLVRGVALAGGSRTFGTGGTHLEFHLRATDAPVGPGARGPREAPRAVWWGGAVHAEAISRARTLDAIVRPKVDTWRGAARVQLDVQDVRCAEPVRGGAAVAPASGEVASTAAAGAPAALWQ